MSKFEKEFFKTFTISFSIFTFCIGSLALVYVSKINKNINKRSKDTDKAISLYFSSKCKESFNTEKNVLSLYSSLSLPETAVIVRERWEKADKWEECLNERV